jgi:NitT/TauT family transport system substrate-binding protein
VNRESVCWFERAPSFVVLETLGLTGSNSLSSRTDVRDLRLLAVTRNDTTDSGRCSLLSIFFICTIYLLSNSSLIFAQTRYIPVRVAYSALSAGIGTLWLTHEQGIFRKYGVDSNLVYIRGGTTAVQALLAGEIQFGHLSPAPMMTVWAQGADFVWIGTTTHRMVFTLLTENSITKGSELKGKKIGITRIGSASDLAVRAALEHFGLSPKDVTMIAMGGIPDILAGMRAGAVNGGILSPPTSTAAREMGYRPLLHIPDLGKEFTFSGIAAKRSFVQTQPEVAKAFMSALTDGARIYKEDARAALRVLRKYMRAEDRILEGGYKEYDAAITSPPYPSLKGLEAVRESLTDSTPALKQIDLRKFVDDRFVRER